MSHGDETNIQNCPIRPCKDQEYFHRRSFLLYLFVVGKRLVNLDAGRHKNHKGKKEYKQSHYFREFFHGKRSYKIVNALRIKIITIASAPSAPSNMIPLKSNLKIREKVKVGFLEGRLFFVIKSSPSCEERYSRRHIAPSRPSHSSLSCSMLYHQIPHDYNTYNRP